MHKSITLEYEYFTDIKCLPLELQKLVEVARNNTLQAYAPYSHFRVGAAILLDNGVIINGNNQENASYPQGMCAERVAMFQASALYPEQAMLAIAICGNPEKFSLNHPLSPCGGCRQVMLEYEKKQRHNMKVILCTMKDELIVFENASMLLPFNFSKDDLQTK